MANKVVNIGILGLGTVGTGVFKVVQNISSLNIKKIADLDINKERDIDAKSLMTTDYMEIINDDEIKIVVEVMGGVEHAFKAITSAIKKGKHVVTANKELIAKKGAEIFQLAEENNVVVLYEASVGGGIPIIMPLKQSLAANKILSIAGILNGTTNYILTKMAVEKAEFADVLKEAQQLGYAEADPTSDIEAYDSAYKISILSSIAFESKVDVTKVYREGISKISTIDIDYASELGYNIKLIALSKPVQHNLIDVRVHPTLVSKQHTLANINGVTNAISVLGDAVNEVNFSGPGAGQLPTASAIVGDILAITSEMDSTKNILPSMKSSYSKDAELLPISETINSYYVRIHAFDKPGVIGALGSACGKHGISLQGVIQKDIIDGDIARIILITHEVKESQMQAAIADIASQESTKSIENVIRVLN